MCNIIFTQWCVILYLLENCLYWHQEATYYHNRLIDISLAFQLIKLTHSNLTNFGSWHSHLTSANFDQFCRITKHIAIKLWPLACDTSRCLQEETTKCEVCEQDVLLRLYKCHLRHVHGVYTRWKETKHDESEAALDGEDDKSYVRGSRAAAQKYVEYRACMT